MSHSYDPTCGCKRCDPVCPTCDTPVEINADTCEACGFDFTVSGRERGDDDGVEYADPRDAMEDR